MKKAIIATASGLLLSASVFVAGVQGVGADSVAYPPTTTEVESNLPTTTDVESQLPTTTLVGQIPASGSDAGTPLALGATVLALGAGLLLVTRRRKHSPVH